MKSLMQMSNEELWELFPIILKEYDPRWPTWYEQEAALVKKAVGEERVLRLSHIGSTSVPELLAKPTVDILMEISGETENEKLIAALERAGYLFTRQPNKPAPHMMFMKGYSPEGFLERVFHLHVRYLGDWDELYFRDYLCIHEEAREQYAALKMRLQQKLEHDRDGYTDAKGAFVREITQLAREEIGERHRPARQG